MSLPDIPHRAGPLCFGLLTAALLSSCGGGGESDLTPSQKNPAAGIYSGSDALGNHASLLITPGGSYVAVLSPASDASSAVSASTAAGFLTTLVFTAPYLYTTDLTTVDAPIGTLLVNYFQGQRVEVEHAYYFGKLAISAGFLGSSFSSDAAAAIPSSGTASVYLPRPTAPHQLKVAAWALSTSELTFSLSSDDCTLDGTYALESTINVLEAAVKPSPGCLLGSSTFSGYLWHDSVRTRSYAVLKKPSEPGSSPIVLVIRP